MPATITRASVIRGPGAVTIGSVQMFDKDGIKADAIDEEAAIAAGWQKTTWTHDAGT
jgi:hypothetical protein